MVKQAQEHANHIIAEANKSSEELKNSSIQYASDVFKYVESNLERTLEDIARKSSNIAQITLIKHFLRGTLKRCFLLKLEIFIFASHTKLKK